MTAVTAVTDHDHHDASAENAPPRESLSDGDKAEDKAQTEKKGKQEQTEKRERKGKGGRKGRGEEQKEREKEREKEDREANAGEEKGSEGTAPESAPPGRLFRRGDADADADDTDGRRPRARGGRFRLRRPFQPRGPPVRRRTDPRAAAPHTDPRPAESESSGAWDDGLIARRVSETDPPVRETVVETRVSSSVPPPVMPLAYDGPLRSRLDALRELVGLSRTRLDSRTLAEAGRVLDEAVARRRLSGQHTVVAIAGATGSGKSQLFNALAGVAISETGVRRPTTAAPIACSWSDGAATLIDRLGIPGRLRRAPCRARRRRRNCAAWC